MGERIRAVQGLVMFWLWRVETWTYQVPTGGVTVGRDLVLRCQDHEDFWCHFA
jgi:hypothetical protein